MGKFDYFQRSQSLNFIISTWATTVFSIGTSFGSDGVTSTEVTSSRFAGTLAFPLLGSTYLGHRTGCIGSFLGGNSSMYVGGPSSLSSLSIITVLAFSSIMNFLYYKCEATFLLDLGSGDPSWLAVSGEIWGARRFVAWLSTAFLR